MFPAGYWHEVPSFAGHLNITAGIHQFHPNHHPPEPGGLGNYLSKDNSDSIIEAVTTMQYSTIVMAAAVLFMAGISVAQNSAQVNLYAHSHFSVGPVVVVRD